MKIITDITKIHLNNDTAIAIGKFDGIHVGHGKLLADILQRKQCGLDTVVFTFDPAPAVLFGYSDGKELMTREEKRTLLEEMGIDVLLEFPLTRQSAAMTPEDFVEELLVKKLRVRYVAAGSDLSFGAGGKGNAELLKRMAAEYGFQVKTIDKVCHGDREVSSTYVREIVEAGDMEQAEQLLGRPYSITGKVVHGNRIGRTMGMPTVNVLPPVSKLLPPYGVYFSTVIYRGNTYRAISNVGLKPTVTQDRVPGVESYLYDFEEEIYGEDVTVCLHEFRRPEKQFESLAALKEQLEKDIRAGAMWRG